MKKLFSITLIAILGSLGFLQYEINGLSKNSPNLGATVPTVVALFETSLASSISSTATSITLVSGTDKAGTSLSGTYGFIIDEGSASEEFVLCTASGTALTSCTRGISVTDGETAVTALQKSHRRGASIKITNYPQLAILSRMANGQESHPNLIYYNAAKDFTTASSSVLIDKNYADNLSFAGAPNASLTVKGISELATVAQINAGTGMGDDTSARLFVNPSYLASSNYASYLPTSGEKAGLAGLLASPSASNKFLTQGNLWGLDITSTQKLLGFSLTASATGDILYRNSSGDYVNLGFGTNGEALIASASGHPEWDDYRPWKSGVDATRDATTNSGTQTIAHGLGYTPIKVRLTAFAIVANTGVTSNGTSNGTVHSSMYMKEDGVGGSNASNAIYLYQDADSFKIASVSFDATNINLLWQTGSDETADSGNIHILWDVQ